MKGNFKRALMMAAGLSWLAFAVFLCVFLFQYLSGGAGLQVFGYVFPVSSGTVFMGLVHFIGFVGAAGLCFAIGVGLCAYGIVGAPEAAKKVGEDANSDEQRHSPDSR
jgi:hypothetical protein